MYSVRKKAGLGLNTSQTSHEANDHGRYASIVNGKRTSFANKHFAETVVKVLLKCVISFSISFVWYAFPHFCALRSLAVLAYASPHKLARPL